MLELRRVKKSYDGVTILEDINLKIQDGEIVSILGRLFRSWGLPDAERQPY